MERIVFNGDEYQIPDSDPEDVEYFALGDYPPLPPEIAGQMALKLSTNGQVAEGMLWNLSDGRRGEYE